MNFIRTSKVSSFLSLVLLAGCFGEGDGPTVIEGTLAPPPPPLPPGFCDGINFEDACGAVSFTDFEGGAASIIDNPDPSGSNTSEKTAQMLKFEVPGGGTFGGTQIGLPAGFDFANGEAFTMQVWSPRNVPVLFKFEGLNQERSLNHSGSGSWETLCYDFSGTTAGPAATGLTIIFDIMVMGMAGSDPANWTFYFDEIEQVDSCGTGGNTTTIPVDFEADPASYNFGMDGGFGGGASDVIANPDASGINTSAQVARMQKFAGEVFGGSTLSLAGNVDFSGGEAFTMKVWSQRVVPVLFKFEGLDQERSVDHPGGSTWEELCFDFTGTTAGPASNALTFIFDLGTNGDAMGDPNNWVFYFDDIQQVADCSGGGGGGPQVSLPVTFEDGDAAFYELQDFGGAATTLVADPEDAGNTVASTNKPPGSELFAGTTVANSNGFGALPFSATETTMTLRVWSPDAGIPVRLKVEDVTDPAISVETEATTTVAAGWEVLTFDFANEVAGTAALNLANTYDKASVFFNFGTDGNTAGDKTYFWESLAFGGGGGGGSSITLPVTFEDGDAAFYELQDFGGIVTSLVADPDDGANTVASSNKPPGAELWGGTTVANVSGFGALPFSATDTSMTLRVWSPDAGIPVRLKVEDISDPAISVETEATTTLVDAWETLTFDFSNEVPGTAALNLANTYDKASVFFNFGTDGNTAGDKTYLWENLAFATGGGGGMTSTDFEGGSYTFNDFGGATTAVVPNPNASGINTSGQVAQAQKFAGEVFAGTTLDLGGPVDLAAADSYTMKVLAQRSVVVTFKLETGGQETTATYMDVGQWEELCFDFTGITGPVTGITVIFDNGTAGDAAGDPDNWTFQFDDIQQLAGSCPTGGGSFSTITFDDPAVTYTLTDFGGNSSTVTNDPVGGSNMVMQTVKMDSAQVWAGTTVSTEAGDMVPAIPLDSANTRMSVNVYSPDAGIPVRLKIEDASNAALSVETEAMTTAVNTWETLVFDFANEVAGTPAFNEANTYNRMSIFFNFGTDGATAGEKTYYADDFAVDTGGGGGSGITLPISFDAGDAAFYELQDFGGVATTLVADPGNGGNTVASTNKPPGAELWGGTTVANVTGFGALPFTATDTTMTLRVWSPDAGIPVRLKVEDVSNAAISVETEATTTVAAGWEVLTFDFANEVAGTAALNIANTYDKASVFFNFGTDGNTAGDKTYLWEDLTFVTGGGGGGGGGNGAFTNGDFETGDFTGWTTTLIPDGVGSVTIDNSGQGGRTGSVARLMAAGSANPAQGNDVLLSQVALAAGTVSPGDTISVSFDLYGSLAGAGGVVFVEVIFLDSNGQDVGGRDFVGPAAPYVPTTTWTNYSGDVIAGTATGGGTFDVSGGVTLQLKAACGAVDGCAVDASFDNVTFTIN